MYSGHEVKQNHITRICIDLFMYLVVSCIEGCHYVQSKKLTFWQVLLNSIHFTERE